jgi:hypothetical protein
MIGQNTDLESYFCIENQEFDQKKIVLVNAANAKLQPGWEGLNRGITNYAKEHHGLSDSGNKWKNLIMQDGVSQPTTPVTPGVFAISDFSNGKIYHAVGPGSDNVGKPNNPQNLPEVKNCLEKLYRDMLQQAKKDGATVVILPIISGAIFASVGKDKDNISFTKVQFLEHVYKGIVAGIQSGRCANLKIIFNTQ